MLTQFQPPRPGTQGFDQRIVWAYGWTCRLLFGKTLSVMAGEAQAQGRWMGCICARSINWLLRDPEHCESEVRDATYVTWSLHCSSSLHSRDEAENYQGF